MSETENGKMIRQECKQRYLYILKMTDSSGGARILEQAGPAAGPKVLW